jgi:hypothetical protein
MRIRRYEIIMLLAQRQQTAAIRSLLNLIPATGEGRVGVKSPQARFSLKLRYGISPISHSVPHIQCTSGLHSAILNFVDGRRLVMSAVSPVFTACPKIRGSRWNFADVSFRSRYTLYFRFTVRHFEFR